MSFFILKSKSSNIKFIASRIVPQQDLHKCGQNKINMKLTLLNTCSQSYFAGFINTCSFTENKLFYNPTNSQWIKFSPALIFVSRSPGRMNNRQPILFTRLNLNTHSSLNTFYLENLSYYENKKKTLTSKNRNHTYHSGTGLIS